MKTNYKEIARLKRREVSERMIAKQLSISRNTVKSVTQSMRESGLSFGEFEQMSEAEILHILKVTKQTRETEYIYPNYERLAKEYSRPGVTMQLLWEEYQAECRLSNRQYYQLTQFKKYFRDYLNKKGFTDIIRHKAGEKTEVDWAGTKPNWQDPCTGEIVYGWMFVGVLPFSGYGFARVFADMKMNNWIQGHIEMFEYFGGVSKILVPDNLKTGIIKNTKNELIINPTYSDMANHYGTIVIPSRVKHPKDKASVEATVSQLTTNIIARMRNYQFFTISEYNEQLKMELDKVNRKPFQKKEGSRYSIFEEIEKPCLLPLPKSPYSMCLWRKVKVASNSHIIFDRCYYSVPVEHIGQEVNLKIYDKELEIYYKLDKIATHELIKGKIGEYSTNPHHMPVGSNAYGDWNSVRYLNWAKQKGPFVHEVVQRQFDSVKVEQQKYRMVHSILKLADTYGSKRLDYACQYALEQYSSPSNQNIKTILVNKQDIAFKENQVKSPIKPRFLRGAEYYEEN